MANTLPCPACQHPNEPTAARCAGCDRALAPSTGPSLGDGTDGATPSTFVRPPGEPAPGSPEAPAIEIYAGNLIDRRYRAEALLGKGGMGEVWCATDTVLGQKVALKLVPAWVPDDMHARQTLIREAQLCIKLSRPSPHPNIAMVYHVDADGRFLVAEYIEGDNLLKYMYDREQQLRRSGMPMGEALDLLEGIARGLDHAHAMGVIHRDVKPSNVLRATTPGGIVPKIIDFGIAGELRREATKFTQPGGAGQGSFPYMSPEQLRSARINARADIYSLGASAYHLISGQLPLTEPGLYHKILDTIPAPIEGQPDRVSAVLLKALAKKPEDRFPTCAAFVQALRDAVEGRGPSLPMPVAPPPPAPPLIERVGRWSPATQATALIGVMLALAAVGWVLAYVTTPSYDVTVKIDSMPQGASVRLDDRAAALGTTPYSGGLDLRRGRHTFILERAGYQAARADRDVAGRGPLAPLAVPLLPLVEIETRPAGGHVSIARVMGQSVEQRARAPATLALPEGGHVVSVELPPYPPQTRSVKVEPGAPGPVRLSVAMPIPLRIDSRPAGARVVCRQRPGESGTTPWSRALTPVASAALDFELSLAGYQPASLQVELAEGQAPLSTTVPLMPMAALASDPPGAMLSMLQPSRRSLGTAPATLSLPVGHYVVTASRPPLIGPTAAFDIVPGAARPVSLTLVLGVPVTLRSRPPGATVSCMTHGEHGVADRVMPLPVGAHRLEASLRGYIAAMRDVTVRVTGLEPSEPFVLAPIPVPVGVFTDPPGATIQCKVHPGADDEKGRAPLTLSLLPGHHEICVTLAQFPEHTWPIDIAAGQGASALNWDFNDQPVLVEIESQPPATIASCTVHGEHLTDTGQGVVRGQLPSGQHSIVLERPGYQTAVETFDLEAGEEPVRVSRELLPLVEVESVPPGASITLVDDRYHPVALGKAPAQLRLQEGQHLLSVALDPLTPQEIRVDVRPGAAEPPHAVVRLR